MILEIISVAFFSALLYVVSYPPAAIWPLCIPAFTIFSIYVFGRRHSWREVFLFVFVFNMTCRFGALYWIPHTFKEFGDIPVVVSWILTVLAFSLLSIPSAVFSTIAVPLMQKYKKTQPIWYLAFWLVWEFCDTRFFSWSAAQTFGSDPRLIVTAAYLGTVGWNVLFYTLVSLSTWLFLRFDKRIAWAWSFTAWVIPLAALSVFGHIEGEKLKAKFSGRQEIAMLQGNVGNFEKKIQQLNEEPTHENVLRIYHMLIEKLALKRIDATKPLWVFWPETAFPGFPLNDSSLNELLSTWAKQTHAYHLLGAYEESSLPSGEPIQYNVVLAYDDKGFYRGHYRKVNRMPFGEYVPGDYLYPHIYDEFKFLSHFGSGERPVALPHTDPNQAVFLPFICFEILDESYVREVVTDARRNFPGRDLVLVNPTNDSWFGEGAELFLHSHLARWQAALWQVPLVRPTNTGISMVIAPWGEILTASRVGVASLIESAVPVTK